MVLWGITYEVPSYLPLPPFNARPPFYSLRLCSAHPFILFPSSHIDSLLLNFYPLSTLFFQPHLSPADPHLSSCPLPVFHLLTGPLSLCPHPSSSLPSLSLSIYCNHTSLLPPIYFPDLLTPVAPCQNSYTPSTTFGCAI